MEYKLSNQAIGAVMLALQKGILEQLDITEMLQNFELKNTGDGLIVNNPPVFSIPESEQTDNKE